MSYPQIIDYNEAVQHPRDAFFDPDLKVGSVRINQLGLPAALSGGFALTYTVSSGSRTFAVRCFHREIPEAQERYAAISAKLRSLTCPYFVDFHFQGQGISVRGKPYPIVKMDWADGDTLGMYLDRIASNAPALTTLRRNFAELAAFLEKSGVAHGDIQNDNVVIQAGAIRLIDYDGMFVPGMAPGSGTEVGQRNFQHPSRETKHFGAHIDRFSFIVIDVSLQALIADASLHRRYREGGQAIIFKANDFAAPASSEVFQKLDALPSVRESARKLAAVCAGPVSAVPSLVDFIAGRNLPLAVSPQVGSVPKPVGYLGAFDVVDAKDYQAVAQRIGDKVELVGKIVSVKEGVGKRGRGKGRPYVFINFGIWNAESVRVTIWSEGLSNMSSRPSASWKDVWISVTGLVEPPFEGSHYGKPYRNIILTVEDDKQVIRLSEKDARFRLSRGVSVVRPLSASPPVHQHGSGMGAKGINNQDILDRLNKGPGRTTVTRTAAPVPPARPSAPRSDNQKILEQLKAQRPASSNSSHAIVGGMQQRVSPSVQPQQPSPPLPLPKKAPATKSGVPVWIWIVGGIALWIAVKALAR